MADIHGSPGDAPQMPAATGPGPAPAPYGGSDLSPEPPAYAVDGVSFAAPGAEVMNGVSGNGVQESGYAHDISAGLVAPYAPGTPSLIAVHGDADAGGRDDAAGTVAGAVANAEARYLEYQSDAVTAGPSQIGDAMTIPLPPEDATSPPNDFLYPQGNQPGA